MAKLWFALRLFAASLRVLRRRLASGPRRPGWSWVQESVIEAMRRNGAHLMALPIADARRHVDALAPSGRRRGVRREPCQVAGLNGCRFIPATAAATGNPTTLLYLPGGGYAFGSVRSYADFLARVSRASGARVLALEYPHAPEHRFPAAPEACLAAYRALVAEGTRPEDIVLGGDSAGGGLALTILLALRDAHEAQPRGAVLISPWVDLSASQPSVTAHDRYDWGDRAYLVHWASLYLGEADPRDPRASPLFADLHGIAPLLIQVGSAELLFDEVTALARRAREAGVAVDLKTWDDMTHAWMLVPDVFPQATPALELVAQFLTTPGLHAVIERTPHGVTDE
ncbi:MAG: 6-hexanolactone hydrolase [Deltaproteobacteria bacterium]|nr:6-hexanolactone hydrolase [Deltaproteobacteria bacterium]